MRHSRSKVAILLVLLASAATLSAAPRLVDLNIRVMLGKNGDARITETRQMYVDSQGTECYISIGNLNGSEVRGLEVSDETGRRFENIGSWDVDRSRSWKEGKCGIVDKGDGYELCWGLGGSGQRTYVTSYTVTRLLKGYEDADGFNYMFVARDVAPLPDHVMVTITPENGDSLTTENTRVWGFRYRGSVNVVDNAVVAESSEAFDSSSAMIVMVRFEKGLFAPADMRGGTFEEVKERAFEGSDYDDDSDFTGEDVVAIIYAVLVFLSGPIITLFAVIVKWRKRKKITKDLAWYRDIPFNGDLQKANQVLNEYKYFTRQTAGKNKNLLSACILQLINVGVLAIEDHRDNTGKLAKKFVIRDTPEAIGILNRQDALPVRIYGIFKEAAGNDLVLEPRELKDYMKARKNRSAMDTFVNMLNKESKIDVFRKDLEESRKVFGLKKFLKEFSLLDERHVQEVALWKDYMVYATLFGIADQVIKDMKKINPEYFNLDQVAQQMADDMTLPIIYSTLHNSTARAISDKLSREARSARSSGGGGHSSWGGGGGFSGGGFGGGVR